MGRSAVLTGDTRVWRTHFAGWLKKRFLLRFHMSLILMLTFLAGIVATRVLLALEVNRLWLRYAIAVFAGYAVFLAAMRVWLWYVGVAARRMEGASRPDIPLELFDAVLTVGDFDLPDVGGGGRFGGGGATGSWESSPPLQLAASASKPVPEVGSEGLGSFFSIDLDDGVFLVVLALAAVLAIAGGYLVYAAPGIMAEAAFDAVLAAALVRRARKVDAPGWVGSVIRATAIPFLAILAISTFAGWYAQRACPTATRLRDAINCVEVPIAAPR
ncbi:MAG: hypothetical protein WA208_14645 [Thermoanaerobaculia bacterium]